MKKAISAATSAALLASLLATAVAPSAFASATLTSVGSIPIGGTSTGTATFLFTERSQGGPACPVGGTGGTTDGKILGLDNRAGSMDVTIKDAAGVATFVSFSGTPVVSAPDSLGATASASGSVLHIAWTHSDCANIETVQVTGLKIKAAVGATAGPVSVTLSSAVASAGADFNAFFAAPTTAVATGTILSSNELTNGVDPANILLSSVCSFAVTGGNSSQASFSDTVDARNVNDAPAAVAGVQTVTFAAGLFAHAAGVTVTQTVDYAAACPAGVLAGSIGVIGNSVAVSYDSTPTVFPGEMNGVAADITATEPIIGFLPSGTVLTFTIATAGVVFSAAPSVVVDDTAGTAGAAGVLGAPTTATLSSDRKSITVTTTSVSTVRSVVEIYNIHYDVAATVPGGTFVDVNLTLSGGLLVTGNPAENAIVFRGITATAPTPTVYIGENNQATGLVTLVEAAPAFFQGGTGSNNVITVCSESVNWTYTTAPSAKVTVGDLRLRDGNVASTTNIVVGTAVGTDCYKWTVWTASTVASTIVIGNSDFTSGPLINVAPNQPPGLVALEVFSGSGANFDQTLIGKVGFAIAAFRNQVAVTALAQPFIPAGAKSKVGAIQIAETANGQLKAFEQICIEVLPRVSNETFQDTYLQALNTADLPIVTATGGLIVGPVSMGLVGERCFNPNMNVAAVIASGTHVVAFHFDILQQSTTGTGKAVIDNINVITTADAPLGPVLFNVFGLGRSPTSVQFQSTISPAKIGTAAALPKLHIGAVSALGLKPTTGYTTKTPKTQVHGKYITWKFTGGTTLAGQRVNVMVAKKVNGAWGGPKYLKSAVADANGIVTFAWRFTSAAAVNVRVQWPGSASYGVSTSTALGGYWK